MQIQHLEFAVYMEKKLIVEEDLIRREILSVLFRGSCKLQIAYKFSKEHYLQI